MRWEFKDTKANMMYV